MSRRQAERRCIAGALASLAIASGAQAQTVRDFDLATVELLGRAIYRHDQAAWRASNALLRLHRDGRVSEAEMQSVRGWIVIEEPEATLVKFVGEGAQGPFAVLTDLSARDEKRALEAARQRGQPLAGAELAQFRARQVAIAHANRDCAQRYNTVVLPGVEGTGFLVYVLAATTQPDVMVLGGHSRVEVSADGSQVIRADRLSRACLTMSLKPKDGDKLKVVTVTHLVSSAPLETHVFLNLQHRMDIAVATGQETIWMVADGRIRRLK